jgi:hypothetical protein
VPYSASQNVNTRLYDFLVLSAKQLIAKKAHAPINESNRKILLFTAFADTADYLYRDLAPWANETLGLNVAVVTGTGANKTTVQGLRSDMTSILSAFTAVKQYSRVCVQAKRAKFVNCRHRLIGYHLEIFCNVFGGESMVFGSPKTLCPMSPQRTASG